MSPRVRSFATLAIKVLVAALLIGWLLRSGNLDLAALRLFGERPSILALDLGLFLLGAVIGSVRFGVLLGITGVRVKLSKLLLLQLIAFFFNVVIPGNIGGDVVKALIIARDEAPEKRTTILLAAFVERLLGVAALVIVGAAITLVRSSTVFGDPLLKPLGSAVTLIGGATLVGGALALVIVRKAGKRLDDFTTGPSKLAKLLNQLVASMRLLSESPKRLVVALGLSMAFHVAAISFFTILSGAVLQRDVPSAAIATVFPLGLLTLLLPISPAGLGVGHVAFQRLFEAIQLPQGATVFNVYLLGQMAPCLLGVFPFLAMKRRGALPPEAT